MQIFRVRTGLVAAATCASLAVAGLPGVPVAVAAPAAAASAADYWDKHDSASVDLKANQSIDDVALGSTITFDVAAPESAPEGGSLSLFVDGQQVDELPATTLQAEYTFNSFGPHIVLARFTDTAGANPVRDAVLTVNVVGPQTRTNSKSPLTATVVGTVNDATSSLESPVEVAPGDTVTYEVSSTVAEKVRRVETGIEPPVGFTYVEESADFNDGAAFHLTTRGMTFTNPEPGWFSSFTDPGWTRSPAPNDNYIGVHPDGRSYGLAEGATEKLKAQFVVPADAQPGLYEAAIGYMDGYGPATGTRALVPLPGTIVKVAAKEVPAPVAPGESSAPSAGDSPAIGPENTRPSKFNARCMSNGAPFGQDAESPKSMELSSTSPRWVREGEEFDVTLTPAPIETEGKADSATILRVDRVKIDMALPSPEVAEVVSYELVGEGQNLDGDAPTVTRINAAGEPAEDGGFLRLSGANKTVGNGPDTGLSQGGLGAEVNGKPVTYTLPAVTVRFKAVGKPGESVRTYLRSEGAAGQFNKPENFLSMAVTAKHALAGTFTLAVNCVPSEKAQKSYLSSTAIVATPKPGEEPAPPIIDDEEPPVEEPPAEQPPSDWFSDFIANPAKLSLAAIIIGIANLLGIGAILATLWGNGMFATFGANGSSGAGVPFWGPHGRN